MFEKPTAPTYHGKALREVQIPPFGGTTVSPGLMLIEDILLPHPRTPGRFARINDNIFNTLLWVVICGVIIVLGALYLKWCGLL